MIGSLAPSTYHKFTNTYIVAKNSINLPELLKSQHDRGHDSVFCVFNAPFSLKNDGIQDAHPVLIVLKKVMLHGTIWNNNFLCNIYNVSTLLQHCFE